MNGNKGFGVKGGKTSTTYYYKLRYHEETYPEECFFYPDAKPYQSLIFRDYKYNLGL